jgi:hypothetical protein
LDRLVLIARLKEGASERARELATAGPESDPAADGFRRKGVFLAPTEIVFVLEGPDADQIVRGFLNDPVRSTAISPWIPLFDGPLHQAVEVYRWPAAD